MRQCAVFVFFVCHLTYSKEIWETLYHHKYLTTVLTEATFNKVTVTECGDMCREYVDKCNIAIYDVVAVNISIFILA